MSHDPGLGAWFLRQHFLALIGQGCFPITVIISLTIHHQKKPAAQNFVKPFTQYYCQHLLGDTSSVCLANASPWADIYKHTSEGSFSRHFHYVDAHDDPTTTCNVGYGRDYGEPRHVVSAIQDYIAAIRLLKRLML